jgi:amidase
MPISAEQDTAGPMTRSIADAAALLDVIAGPDPTDTATTMAHKHSVQYTKFLDATALTGARLGIWRKGSAKAGSATIAVLEQACQVR